MQYVLKTIRIVSFIAFSSVILLVAGCDSEEPDPSAGETELITRVRLTLTPMAGGSPIVVQAEDPDGDGANLSIDALQLNAGTTYLGAITLYDAVNDVDVSAEVLAEAEEHQFWYAGEGGIADRITVTLTDRDANDLPIGLAFTLAVSDGAAATGSLNVALSHYDASPKTGTDRSDETDVDIDFPVSIVP